MLNDGGASAAGRGIRKVIVVAIIVCLVWGIAPLSAFSAEGASPPPGSTPTPTPSASPLPESTPSPTPSASGPPESTPSPTPSASGPPESTPSPTPSASPSPTPSASAGAGSFAAAQRAVTPVGEVFAADTSPAYGAADAFDTKADADTGNGYANIFTAAAGNANDGRVWTDKSVKMGFGADADELPVTLSAMGQAIQTTETRSVPSDTVFVLDISYSMIGRLNTGESRAVVMVDALNDAIQMLMEENENNRIAVVAFGGESGASRIISVLTLDRYPEVTDKTYFSIRNGTAFINVNSNIPDAKLGEQKLRSIRVLGGTSTQNGIYAGAQVLLDPAQRTTCTVGDDVVIRKPNIVMLTDGGPTFGWQDYSFANRNSDTPGGFTNGNGNDVDMGVEILTVLTASYFKREITEKYYGNDRSKSAGFYTIGLGVADSDDARATLDPMGVRGDADDGYNAGKVSEFFQDTIYNMQGVLDELIQTGSATFPILGTGSNAKRALVTLENLDDQPIRSYDYVDYYAAAETAEELRDFFRDITEMIVAVGGYATSVIADPEGMYSQNYTSFADYSGAVVFSDVIGEYMEVKSADHIRFENRQYNGAVFAHQIERENQGGQVPDNIDRIGPVTYKLLNAMFASQLFFSSALASGKGEDEMWDDAVSLLESSLAAGNLPANGGRSGVYYNSATDFGNRVRFFADGHGTFLGNYFTGAGGPAPRPAEAVCVVDLYFVSGATHNPVSGNPSDLVYSIFQVITALDDSTDIYEKNFSVPGNSIIDSLPLPAAVTPRVLRKGQQMVRWVVPASLLPLCSVREGKMLVEAVPIRFQYSVGLRSGLSLSDLRSGYSGLKNGEYYFYANAWEDPEANAALAHFAPAAENPYYARVQDGAESAAKGVGNQTLTVPASVSGPFTNPDNNVRYYALGNNGRMKMPTATLTVTKTWDGNLVLPSVHPVYIQLYGGDGLPIGNAVEVTPTPVGDPDDGWVASTDFEGLRLQLCEVEADANGQAKLIPYTVAEGTWNLQDGFHAYDATAPFKVEYLQPGYSGNQSLTAEVFNSEKNALNWVLDLRKRFVEDGPGGTETPISAAEIGAALNSEDESVDFYIFTETEIETSPGSGQYYYIQSLMSEWETPGRYTHEPMRYPEDFANGQRSIWFDSPAGGPASVTYLIVEVVDRSLRVGDYEYAPAPVTATVGGAPSASVALPDENLLYSPELTDGVPTGVGVPFVDYDAITGGAPLELYVYEFTVGTDGGTARVDFTNHLTPVPPPAAQLTLQKTFGGVAADDLADPDSTDPADLGVRYAASFTVEGWTSPTAAENGVTSERIFYRAVSWAEMTRIANNPYNREFGFGPVPPGHYTITETAPTHIRADDGSAYDKSVSAELNKGSGAVTTPVGGDPQRNYSTVAFDVAEGENAVISLENLYTERGRLIIEKTFAPLPNPVPDDVAFTVSDSLGKTVRFISYDPALFDDTPPNPNGGAYVVKDLLPGTYTVSEIGGDPMDGFYPVAVTVTPSGGGVVSGGVTVQAGGSATVSFTNTYTPLPQGSLTIRKELTGFPEDWGVGGGTAFRVRVKDVTDADPLKQGYLIFDGENNRIGQLSLIGGTELEVSESARTTVFGLEQNHRYQVEEVVPEGAVFDAPRYESGGLTVTDTGVEAGGDPLTVTVINNYPHGEAGSLVVSKALLGSYGDWGVTDSTQFHVRVYDVREGEYLWFVEGTNSDQPQARAASSGGTYWCVGNDTDGFSEAVERSRAVYTELPVTPGAPLTLQNLWADQVGWRYRIEEVKEAVPAGEDARYNNEGDIEVVLNVNDTAGIHVPIRNTFRQSPGNLVITKRLAGSPADWGVGDGTPFRARVRAAGTQNYLTFDANNKHTGFSAEGSAVTFSRSSPAVLTEIPTGRYVVEEIVPVGSSAYYAVSYEGDVTGATSAGGEVDLRSDGPSRTVVAVNTYQHDTGRLIVKKSLSGYHAEEGASGATGFSARVYEKNGARENILYFAPVNGEMNLYRCVGSSAGISDPAFRGAAVDNARLFDTIPFSEDRAAILDELWVNVTYRVEEVGGDQYNVRYANNGQEIPQDGDANAAGNVSVDAINTYYKTPGGGGGDGDGDGGGDGGDITTRSASTGDDSNVIAWLVVFLSSVSALAGTLVWRGWRRKRGAR